MQLAFFLITLAVGVSLGGAKGSVHQFQDLTGYGVEFLTKGRQLYAFGGADEKGAGPIRFSRSFSDLLKLG